MFTSLQPEVFPAAMSGFPMKGTGSSRLRTELCGGKRFWTGWTSISSIEIVVILSELFSVHVYEGAYMVSPSHDRIVVRRRDLLPWVIAAIVVVFTSVPTWAGSIIVGTLSTTDGASIPSADLSTWLTTDLGTSNPQDLVVLTECFGGNTAQAFAPISTTSSRTRQCSRRRPRMSWPRMGLTMSRRPVPSHPRPGPAQDVQNAGIAKKAPGETPTTSGGLAPNNFSLAPSAAGGPIQSRQVLVYAGQPGGNGTDVAIRNTISANWNNKLDTVTTIGTTGGGVGGWANEGSAFGLKSAIDAAGKAINGGANPAQQQLILFVTDHGGLRNVATDLNRSAPNISLVGGGNCAHAQCFHHRAHASV